VQDWIFSNQHTWTGIYLPSSQYGMSKSIGKFNIQDIEVNAFVASASI